MQALDSVFQQALFQDTASTVVIMDERGTILETNRPIRDGHSVIGVTLEHLVDEHTNTETLRLIAEALESNELVKSEGLYLGDFTAAVFRPLPADEHNPPRVLIVATALSRTVDALGPTPDLPTFKQRLRTDEPLSKLTIRELEVLQHIGHGLSTNEIAQRLDRSVKTVEGHRASIGKKLNVANRVELAWIAIRAGLVRNSTS